MLLHLIKYHEAKLRDFIRYCHLLLSHLPPPLLSPNFSHNLLLSIIISDFIEIKSVTYCGKSDASSLTMENVPWHRECCQFSEAIANRCVLSARTYVQTTWDDLRSFVWLTFSNSFQLNSTASFLSYVLNSSGIFKYTLSLITLPPFSHYYISDWRREATAYVTPSPPSTNTPAAYCSPGNDTLPYHQ